MGTKWTAPPVAPLIITNAAALNQHGMLHRPTLALHIPMPPFTLLVMPSTLALPTALVLRTDAAPLLMRAPVISAAAAGKHVAQRLVPLYRGQQYAHLLAQHSGLPQIAHGRASTSVSITSTTLLATQLCSVLPQPKLSLRREIVAVPCNKHVIACSPLSHAGLGVHPGPTLQTLTC